MRSAALLAALLLAACEEHGKSPLDGPVPGDAPLFPDGPEVDAFGTVGNPGFVAPAQAVAAWTETSPGSFAAATLDLSCLGVMRVDPAIGQQVTVTATVRDFQSDNTQPGATVTAFAGANPSSVLSSSIADGSGVATLTIPQGTKRFGYKVESTNSRPTFVHDQLLVSTGPQAVALASLSDSTVQTLPALVGVSATPSTSILLGRITDCQGHTLSNAIATVSGTTGMAMHLPGVDTYYFADSVDLPVRHSQQAATSKDGQFMVIDVPVKSSAVIQVWGIPEPGDVPHIRILAELIVPFASSTAVITRHDPRATR